MSIPLFPRANPEYPLKLTPAITVAFILLASGMTRGEGSVSRLIVEPAALELTGAGASHGLLVTAIGADGRVIDVTRKAKITAGSSIVKVEAAQVAAVNDGSAQVTVEFGGQRVTVPVTVAQSAVAAPPSFRNDVVPLLTRYGCNSGGCHGKLAGQNGFRLSLRGFAPEQDYEWITREFLGRRINRAMPEDSLLLRKPLLKAPHEGGRLIKENSRAHRMLLDWIAAGAASDVTYLKKNKPDPAKPQPAEVKTEKITVLAGALTRPGGTLRPGESQQLLIRAGYTDGASGGRDVTWLSQFFSADSSVATVDEHGRITCKAPGETAVRVQFDGQVEVVIVTSPYDQPIDDKAFPPVAPGSAGRVIDQHVFAKLKALRIPPAPLCDDLTFLRRASLDATGTLPTPEEVEAFIKDARPDKRARLVDDLLARDAFTDYWTLQLADLLQNRKERDHDVRGPKGVRQFHYWLRQQVAANKPWDQLAREVLTATGSVNDNPAVGYFITVVGEKRPADRSEVVASVAQAFLGTRIGCAQCHNHPSEKYTQDDYYHFAAFFARVNMQRVDSYKDGYTALVITSDREREVLKDIDRIRQKLAEIEARNETEPKKVEEKNKQIADQKKQLENKQKELADARMPRAHQPRTNAQLMPQPLDRSAMNVTPDGDARAALTEWMARSENPHFAGAMVNRVWKHFMRAGLVEPVDDLRASNPPTNPALWNALVKEFASPSEQRPTPLPPREGQGEGRVSNQLKGHEQKPAAAPRPYDLRALMRLVMNSTAYQLSSATTPANELDVKFHSHYYAKRLPAEVLLDAVSQATLVPDEFPGYPRGLRAIQVPDPGVSSYFLGLFGRSDRVTACACERTGEVTLPQLLHMQNGEVLKKIGSPDGRLMTMIKAKADEGAVIDTLFLATLSRRPSDDERSKVLAALKGAENREEAMQDLFWALINAKEFAFNH